jgi:exodeoxyribonuclease VII large subunit
MPEAESAGDNAPPLSVTELSSALKRTIEDRFGYVRVRGEISNYRGPHSSGHVYFSLKDQGARIDAVIWRTTFSRMRVRPEEGLEVIATGKITTFPGKSAYQIIVEAMEPAGVGALMALLEARRVKLAAEGLFDASRKQSLPYLPRTIGVVTSPTGAVIRDILHRLADRAPVHVLVWPVRVQGETSAAEVAAAIRGFNAFAPGGAIERPDVLIVARGGGSLEDLWSFNEETVVRAAAESLIPLISAIGHETDWTLLDHVADVRAPTPTAAAELSVPVRAELLATLAGLGGRLNGAARRVGEQKRTQLRASSRALASGEEILAGPRQRLDRAATALANKASAGLRERAIVLGRLAAGLGRHTPAAQVAGARARLNGMGRSLARAAETDRLRRRERLARLSGRLQAGADGTTRQRALYPERLDLAVARLRRAIAGAFAQRRTRLNAAWQLADALGYHKVLERGFALVRDARGEPVRRAAGLVAEQMLRVQFADGEIGAQVRGDSAPAPGRVSGRDARPRRGGGATGQGSLF